jgi:hypothetical protein
VVEEQVHIRLQFQDLMEEQEQQILVVAVEVLHQHFL